MVMLARGNKEYAFRVLDSAQIPKEPIRPKRLLLVVLGTVVGGLLAVFFILMSYAVMKSDD